MMYCYSFSWLFMHFVIFTHIMFSLNKIGSHSYSEVATEQWGHRATPDRGTAWEEAGGVWRDGEDHEEVWRWSAIPKKKNIAKKDPGQAPPSSLSPAHLMAINSIGPSCCVDLPIDPLHPRYAGSAMFLLHGIVGCQCAWHHAYVTSYHAPLRVLLTLVPWGEMLFCGSVALLHSNDGVASRWDSNYLGIMVRLLSRPFLWLYSCGSIHVHL